MSPFTQGGPVALTPKEFHYAFANTPGREESDTPRTLRGTRPTGLVREHALVRFLRAARTTPEVRRNGARRAVHQLR
jgi:hypothetical protein